MNTPVNFLLAKLLKEKGFDVPVKQGYGERVYFESAVGAKNFNDLSNYSANFYSAPTIAVVLMWLYDTHQIWIYTFPVEPFDDGGEYPKVVWISKVLSMNQIMFEKYIDADNGLAVNHHASPQQALIAGITHVLNNSIKQS